MQPIDPYSNPESSLSRRERQIMDLVFAHRRITAREVLEKLPDPPGYSSVRKLLSVLVEKGELRALAEGRALVYEAVRSRKSAARSALNRLVDTFFGGSVESAVNGLLDMGEKKLTPEEVAKLRQRIEELEGGENHE